MEADSFTLDSLLYHAIAVSFLRSAAIAAAVRGAVLIRASRSGVIEKRREGAGGQGSM